MTTRRIGATWFSAAVPFNDFVRKPHGYYSVDGAPAVDLGEIDAEAYQSEPDGNGQTVTLYGGVYNPIIPEGAEGDNVVLTIMDPLNENDVLEYDSIDVCTDMATTAIISPSSASISISKTRQLLVVFYAADDIPTDNHDPVVWSTDASGPTQGSIGADTGIFTAGTEPGGPYTVTATAGAVTDGAAITVVKTTVNNNDNKNSLILGVCL